jgi:hypothetical protein
MPATQVLIHGFGPVALSVGRGPVGHTVDRDIEIAIELICEHVLAAMNRICLEREDEEMESKAAGRAVNLRR